MLFLFAHVYANDDQIKADPEWDGLSSGPHYGLYPPNEHHVRQLPGYEHAELEESFITGYLPVDPHMHSQLFYWLVQSRTEQQQKNDGKRSTHHEEAPPLIFWMNGGPGCTSHIGAYVENGPFVQDTNHPIDDQMHLIYNQWCWCNTAHMLYVDQPIGVGLSFTAQEDGANPFPTTQSEVAKHMTYALQHFYKRHPKLRRSALYLAGESYAGKYIPWLATNILESNSKIDVDADEFIPLEGIIIGNGMVDPVTQRFAYRPIMVTNGFFDQYQNSVMMSFEEYCRRDLINENFTSAFVSCSKLQKYMTTVSGGLNLFDYRQFWSNYNQSQLIRWMNSRATRIALGVPETGVVPGACVAGVHQALKDEFLRSTKEMLGDLFVKTRVLLYNGLFDLKDGPMSTETYVNSIDWNGTIGLYNAERYVLKAVGSEVDANDGSLNNVLGYCKTYENVSLCTLTHAGHLAPLDSPHGSFGIINRFVHKHPMCNTLDDGECDSVGKEVCEFMECTHGTCSPSEGGECFCDNGWAGVDCNIKIKEIYSLEDEMKERLDALDIDTDNDVDINEYFALRHSKTFTLPALQKNMYWFRHKPINGSKIFITATLHETETAGEAWVSLSFLNDDDGATYRKLGRTQLNQWLAEHAEETEHRTHIARTDESDHSITSRARRGYYVFTIFGRHLKGDLKLHLSIELSTSVAKGGDWETGSMVEINENFKIDNGTDPTSKFWYAAFVIGALLAAFIFVLRRHQQKCNYARIPNHLEYLSA